LKKGIVNLDRVRQVEVNEVPWKIGRWAYGIHVDHLVVRTGKLSHGIRSGAITPSDHKNTH
jgi:hypothetical protein